VVRKAVRRSIRKRRAQPRRRRALPPDLGPVADNLPNEETSDNLPPVLELDRPSSWSAPPTPEQLKEREELRKAGKRLENFLNAPQRVIVVESASAKPTIASQPKLTDEEIRMLSGDDQSLPHERREIRRFAFRKFGDWRDVPVSVVERAAAKDPEFLQRVGGVTPHLSSFKRALPRRKKDPDSN
jgi:hypothetical protein